MGQQQSKDELLYQQVSYGNIEGIRALRRDGAGLEWIDKEGKTPLIAACMNPMHHDVAKTLIELGANVNAYRAGRHAGTPLHHAAKRGLENIVKLLLSHGANPLVMNDDCQTPLEVARAKNHCSTVRAIEAHICLFSGWMREFYGPGFLEAIAPQFLSRRVWVVVLPTGSRRPTKPYKLELAIYPNSEDPQPRAIVALWKANLEEPTINQSDPSVTIVHNATIQRGRRRRRRARASHGGFIPQIARQTRFRLAPAKEGDWQQLQRFCDACKGISRAAQPPFLLHDSPTAPVTAPSVSEDLDLAMAINASLQSAVNVTPNLESQHASESSGTTSSATVQNIDAQTAKYPSKASGTDWTKHEAGPSSCASQPMLNTQNSTPSAPPVTDDVILNDGPVHYPAIDFGPVEISSSPTKGETLEDGNSSSCVVCLDAPSEAACVPCGHVAGCFSCLTEIKAKKWGCPVCRTQIDQVIRLYRV